MFNLEYNVLKVEGSSAGRTLSEETKNSSLPSFLPSFLPSEEEEEEKHKKKIYFFYFFISHCVAGTCFAGKKNEFKCFKKNRGRLKENNPMFGLTHSKKTCTLMAAKREGKNLSETTKAKIFALLSGDKHPLFGKEWFKESIDKIRLPSSQKSRDELEVLDLETNSKTVYPSVRAAAKALGISSSTIAGYFSYSPNNSQKKPCKGRYIFSKDN